MKSGSYDDYIKVERVEAFFYPINSIPVIVCYLEDGRQFYLFQVPPEIVISINRLQGIKGYEELSEAMKRDSIYEILENLSEIKEIISKRIEKVIVNDMIKEYGVYVAVVELKFNGIVIERRMIPSHAIYLALLGDRPIYIKKTLVDEQEKESSKK
jgi:bifunctional DNase/RNase